MNIKDITGATVEVTDLDAAIEQLREFCLFPCPYKMAGTQYTEGENHAFMLKKLELIKKWQDK